jgi:hypothetical protein
MASGLERKVNDWLLHNLGRIPVAATVPVSLAVAVLIGGLLPAFAHMNRLFSGLFATTGAVLGMMPLVAVLISQRELDERRLLLLRNGYAEGIGSLSSREFEHLIAAWYESQTYRVVITGRSGDQGIDLRATRGTEVLAVQCKRWRTKQVGPREVRELRGSVIDPKIKPVLVTSGTITEAARLEAREKGVELVDGRDLIKLLNAVITDSAPLCPLCRGHMRPKDGKRGTFWSCLAFPECRGSLDLAVRRVAPT